jgi:hypothetical protein
MRWCGALAYLPGVVGVSAKVIPFRGITKLDLDPDMILENKKGQLEGVVIMGFDHDGKELFASSYADGGTVLWLLERCRIRLMQPEE